MNEVKISIILPTYNVEKYIARALNSCINQSLKDIEIIVVDDCGSDNSIKIAKEFTDNRIKIIKNPHNLGLFHSRAKGVKFANAKYIMFLDPDDELALNACELALKNQKNDDEIVYFNGKHIFNNKKELVFSEKNIKKIKINEIVKQNFKTSSWQMWNKLYLKELYLKTLEKINTNENIIMAEDALFCFFYYENFKNFVLLPDVLYKYYQNEESCCNTKDNIKILKNYEDYKKVLKIMSENIKYDYQKKFFEILKKDFFNYIAKYKLFNKVDLKKMLFFNKKDKFMLISREYKQKNLFKYLYYKLRFLLAKDEGF